jgi:hypothetical protein
LVIVSILTVCITTVVSAANLLDGLWFKLKLSVKGEEMNSTSNDVSKISISAPVYANFVGTSTNHVYSIHYWTLTDAGWTNAFTGTYTGIGTNDYFFPDTSVTLLGVSGISVHTYHTVFVDSKLTSSGTVKSAKYTGVGEINYGTLPDGAVTNFIFGGDTISGSTVQTNKLPFTAP